MNTDEVGEIQSRVNKCLIETLDLDPNEINPRANLRGLGIDSLAAVEMAMGLEDEFEIEAPIDEIENLKTMQDVYTFIERQIATLQT